MTDAVEVHDGRRSEIAEFVDPPRKDGFRPRRKRPKGWLKEAIKDGSVRDPNAPSGSVTVIYDENVRVFNVPMATSDVVGEEK